jgi:hypothetical protein
MIGNVGVVISKKPHFATPPLREAKCGKMEMREEK